MGKFKIGDRVKFKVDEIGDGISIPEYFYEDHGIPEYLINHGSTIVDKDEYKKNFAGIKSVYEDGSDIYYIVEYKDNGGEMVTLGFKEDVLELVNTIKFKIGDRVKCQRNLINGSKRMKKN